MPQTRTQKRLLNQVRHLAAEAERLHRRVEVLCPPAFRDKPPDDDDTLWTFWHGAVEDTVLGAFALHELANELDPQPIDDDDYE